MQRTSLPPVTHDVLTQHNDNFRSGAMLAETRLTATNVSPSTFGPRCQRTVGGKVYAQPLYAENVWVPSLYRYANVLYVATLDNNIYAFDADNLGSDTAAATLWQRIGNGVDFDRPARNVDNANFGARHDAHIGILSTPVIDRSTSIMYVVDAQYVDDTHKTFRLHALDLGTGIEGGAVTVGDYAYDPYLGTRVTFQPDLHLNRPGLLLANGLVYVAFGSTMDAVPYHGWVFAYRADTLQRVAGYTTTGGPTRIGGGIWQSGNGLAADERGHIYFLTGNGMPADGVRPPPSTPERQEDSFVKIDPTRLGVESQYWPHQTSTEFNQMESYDADLGSGGVMLVPGQDALIGGGKPGKLYNLDRTLSEHQAPMQAFLNTWGGDPSTYPMNPDGAPNIHGAPVYWATSDPQRSYVYAWSEKDALKAFPYDRHWLYMFGASMSGSVTSRDRSMPGGMLSLSANGTTARSGVVWAVVEEPFATCTYPPGEAVPCSTVDTCDALCYTVPGHFFAFDAERLGTPLYDAAIPRYSKFTPPTVANGKVVIAADGNVTVYGLY
jgi:hypothetical protein